jgi:hypothetical protein
MHDRATCRCDEPTQQPVDEKRGIGEGRGRGGDSHATRAEGDASAHLPFRKELKPNAIARLSGLWHPAKSPGMWLCHAAIVGVIVSHALSCIVRFAGVKAQSWYMLRSASRTHDAGVLHN